MTTPVKDLRIEPGSVKINSAVLINKNGFGLDIVNLVAGLNLYESINSPFFTGNINVTDAAAVKELFPLMGEEQLILDIETPGLADTNKVFRRKMHFMVYKMTNAENVAEKQVFYTLHFVSIEGFTDINVKISQTYRGNISETVQKLVKNQPGLISKKEIAVENTTNNETYTSNFWTPTQNIYYLTTKAINSNNNNSYVFFENNEGFIFSSLEGLMKAGTYMNLFKHNKTRKPGEPQSAQEEYEKVLDISIPEHFDYYQRLQSGFYGGSIYHYDIFYKRLNFFNRLAKPQWGDKHMHLNKYLAISDNLQFTPDSVGLTQVIHRKLYNDTTGYPLDHSLKRMATLSWIEAQKINVRVLGRWDYSVGRIVNLTAYTNTAISSETPDDQIIDYALSGNYLITAISHEITKQAHYCNIEMCKDSFIKDLNRE